MHIDEPRGHDAAAAIDRFGALRDRQKGADVRNPTVTHQDIAVKG
jgi:hypothetical protein